jgi:two-component system OmpR family sensor kinase
MTLVLAVGVAVLCFLAYSTVRATLTAEVDRILLHEAVEYSTAMRGSTDTTTLAAASRRYLQDRTGASAGPDPILLVLADGRIISNSSLKLEQGVGNTAATEPTRAPAGFLSATLGGTSYRVLSAPIANADGSRVGLFQAALSAESPASVALSVAAALGAAGIIVILGGAAISVWAARQSLRPLRRMAADAAAVTHASPGRRIAYDGPADELGSLSTSLNAMLARLERAYQDQRRFVADASHELRTPVAIVRGNVELLSRGSLCEADASESLNMIEEEALRMTRLLDELLALARLEGASRHFQPLETRTLLDEAAAAARALGERVVTVEGASGLWVSGDPDLLKQALLNIARNSIAHTEPGGHLDFVCSAVGNRVFLSVTDDGPGIPPDDLERIFDRFFRTGGPRPEDSGGAGLGLAITSRLVDLHDGGISAENVDPHGARFTIELPRIVAPG